VNNCLEILKSTEFKNQGINDFYPIRPLEKYYKQIINSSLNKNLKKLP
jgi:hypothetical protein